MLNKNVNPWLNQEARESLNKNEQFILLDARFEIKAFEDHVQKYVDEVNENNSNIHIKITKNGAWKSEDLKGNYRSDKPKIRIDVKSNVLENKQYDPIVIKLEGYGADSNWYRGEDKLDQRWAVRRNDYNYGEVRKYKSWVKAYDLLVNKLENEIGKALNDIDNKIRFDKNDKIWTNKKNGLIEAFELDASKLQSTGLDQAVEIRVSDNGAKLHLDNSYDTERLLSNKPRLTFKIDHTVEDKAALDALLDDIEDLVEKHNIIEK